MSTQNSTVLVFGAAGGVGRHAAVAASKRGANVWLAMRDTNKAIKGLTSAEERDLGFSRIEADLSDLASLKEAVTKSGATAAFVYTLHGSQDRMRSAFDTLKESGIDYLIILSSWSVQPSPEAAKNYSFIPRFHAETELQLAASGLRYVAVRPAYFNSNILWNVEGLRKNNEVHVLGAEAKFDWIAPEDIGAVVGTLLAESKFRETSNVTDGNHVYLCGPKLISLRDAWKFVASELGREIKVTDVSEEDFLRNAPFPPPIAESVAKSVRDATPPHSPYGGATYNEGVANVRKYTEREPTGLREWIAAHKADFL